jgi:hypothetical protein
LCARLGPGLLGTLISLMVAEKSGFHFDGNGQSAVMKELADKLSKQAIEAMTAAGNVEVAEKAEVGKVAAAKR